jgi:hypothetical protein
MFHSGRFACGVLPFLRSTRLLKTKDVDVLQADTSRSLAMSRVRFVLLAAVLWAAALVMCQPIDALAQAVTNLHPAGAANSIALGVQGGEQVGGAIFGAVQHAGLWSGSADSWVDLHPAGSTGNSTAFRADSGKQVGIAEVGGVLRASLWSGTAASWVDLHPAGAESSDALDMDNGQQVGSVSFEFATPHASLWSGSAASWVDLNPSGFPFSGAVGVHNGQQVGYVDEPPSQNATQLASLWTGTAASWVSLHPSGASLSDARGVHNGQQVGYATIGGDFHASLWSGTAASWVDLHPAGATSSLANGVFDGWQVGQAGIGGMLHASLWHGTAASWVDLSLDLTGSWRNTIAQSVWSDGSTLFIAGKGDNLTTNRTEALLWTRPVPEPGSLALCALGVVAVVLSARRGIVKDATIIRFLGGITLPRQR